MNLKVKNLPPGSAQQAGSKKTDRMPHLDALRGWAAFGVIITHAGIQIGGSMPGSTTDFAYGVQLFYTLSAFMLFWTHYARHATERDEARNFYLRRFFRIAPLFWPVVLIASAWLWITRDASAPGPFHIASVLLFVNGFFPKFLNSILNVEWSVATEMLFYAVMPLLLRYITTLERAVYLLIGSLVVGEYATLWLVGHPALTKAFPPYAYFWFPNQMSSFAFGIVGFFLSRLPISRAGARMLMVGGLAFMAALYIGGGAVRFLPHQMLYEFSFVAIILSLGVRSNAVLVNSVTEWFGKISFSVYLLHLPILLVLSHHVLPGLSLSPLAGLLFLVAGTTALVGAVGTLTERYIETPGKKFGNDYIKRLNRRSLVVVHDNESGAGREASDSARALTDRATNATESVAGRIGTPR
ncbi:acyltransferase family protein [Burkholderia latens]|uniref:acyltransferase family protein n=1 Tax=Burkholderia latens TaxID=488446 RepID=UPI001AE1845A|nr:acyltransferase [Burkholderia latens]QTO42196.1 acyltransferase [Burkholderia latens]